MTEPHDWHLAGTTPDGDFDVHQRFVPRRPGGGGAHPPPAAPPPAPAPAPVRVTLPNMPPPDEWGGSRSGAPGDYRVQFDPRTGKVDYSGQSNPASTRQYIVLIVVILLGALGVTVAVSFGPHGEVIVKPAAADNKPAASAPTSAPPDAAASGFYSLDHRRERIVLTLMGTMLYRSTENDIGKQFCGQIDDLRDKLNHDGGDWRIIFDASAPASPKPEPKPGPTPTDPKPDAPTVPDNAWYSLDNGGHRILLTANASELYLNGSGTVAVQLRAELADLKLSLEQRTKAQWLIVPVTAAQPPPTDTPPSDDALRKRMDALRELLRKALGDATGARGAVYPVLPGERERLDRLVGQLERAIGMTE